MLPFPFPDRGEMLIHSAQLFSVISQLASEVMVSSWLVSSGLNSSDWGATVSVRGDSSLLHDKTVNPIMRRKVNLEILLIILVSLVFIGHVTLSVAYFCSGSFSFP